MSILTVGLSGTGTYITGRQSCIEDLVRMGALTSEITMETVLIAMGTAFAKEFAAVTALLRCNDGGAWCSL
jgi:hypothetical protein